MRSQLKYSKSMTALVKSASTFAIIGSLMAGASAAAQEVAADQSPTGEDAAQTTQASTSREQGVTMIIVKGRKRSENLQRAPIAITAVGADLIQDTSASTATDIGRLSPNVDLSSNVAQSGGGNAQAFIRGIGQLDFLITTDPGVGIYTDGVYLGRTTGANLSLLDVDAVEILRGPQGTLFGRNTIGGAIVVNTKRSSSDFEGYFQGTYGEFDRLDGQLGLSGPLVEDVVGVRLALATFNRDGYVDSESAVDFGSIEQYTGRLSFDIYPTDNLDFRIVLDGSKQDQAPVPLEISVINPDAPVLELYNNLVGFPSGQPFLPPSIDGDPLTIAGDAINENDHEIWGIANTITWDTPIGEFKSITGYRELEATFGRDCDNTPLAYCSTFNEVAQNQFSQEIQLNGSFFDGRFEWTTGAYYYSEQATDLTTVRIASGLFDALEALPAPLPCLDPVSPPPVCAMNPALLFGQAPGGLGNPLNETLNLDIDVDNEIDTEAYALFFQGYLSITDRLKFEAGIRYSDEEKRYVVTQQRLGSAGPFLDNVESVGNFDAVTGRVGLSYEVTPDIFVYASATRGFKSGGFNGRPSVEAAVEPFDPEFLWTYELGAKTQFFNDRLRFNITGFYNDYTDIQLSVVSLDVETGQFLSLIDNAAAAKSYGFEIEALLVPVDGLSVNAGFGLLRTEYTDIGNATDITENSVFPRAPEETLNLGAQYDFTLTPSLDAFARADYFYQSSIFQDVINAPETRQEGYSLVNIRAGIELVDQGVEISGFVTNLFDKEYIENGGSALSSLGTAEVIAGRPREWGIQLTSRF